MSSANLAVVANVCDELLDGTQATARGPIDTRRAVLNHSSNLADRVRDSGFCCAQLADLMVACYHLGREQALERVAIGLDTLSTESPRPAVGRPDGYDNVPIDDEEVCLGDEPKPPAAAQGRTRAERLANVDPKEWTK